MSSELKGRAAQWGKKPNTLREKQLTRRRLDYIERLTKGEHYLVVSGDMGIPRSTAWEWMRKAVKVGMLDPNIAATAGLGASPRKTRGEQTQAKELVLELLAAGHNTTHAAEIAGVPVQTAYDWKRKFTPELIAKKKAEIPPDPIAYESLEPEARATLDSFAEFRHKILGRTWNPPWAVQTADKLLELYFSDDDEFVVLNEAPGIGKSTLVTHDFVVWAVTLMRAKGIEPTILLGHRNNAKARWYVKRCRQSFSHNRNLIWTYGRFQPTSKLAPWSTEELLVEPLKYADLGEKEPTIAAGSYDASILSGRYKLVIWDDLIDKTNSSTPEQREAMTGWWQQEAETRLEPGGLLVLSNARWGPEDLSWFVCTQTDPEDIDEFGAEKPLYTRIRHAVHDESLCTVDDEGNATHTGPWPDGCLLDPVRASYKRIRRFLVQDTRRFRLVWQQEDTDPVGFLAQKAWFDGGTDSYGAVVPGCFVRDRMFGQKLLDEAPLLSIVTVDPSGSKKWAVGHWLVYTEGRHYLYNCRNGPMKAPDLLYREQDGTFTGTLEEYWQAANDDEVPFTYLIVEGRGAQNYLMQYEFFRSWCAARGVALIPHDTNRSNKPDPKRGVEMLGPLYRHGRCLIPYMGYRERILGDNFRREACSYPEGSTSDLVMMHWFLAHRMELLVTTEIADQGEDDDENLPWVVRARGSSTPRWARHRLDGDRKVSA